MTPSSESYFVARGAGRYVATERTSGAWSTSEQHISPMAGLVVHAVDLFVAAREHQGMPDDRLIGRMSMDILGVVGVDEVEVVVDVLRPGRTVEMLEAVVVWAGRPVVRARVWRMARWDSAEVAGGEVVAMPPPSSCEPWRMSELWPGDYIGGLEVLRAPGHAPGRSRVWVSTPVQLVAGEETGTLARFMAMVDTANGIAVRRSPREWMFPNLDLTVHLHRRPVAGPVGLDTTVVFGPEGLGVTSTTLHDQAGPVGRAQQVLTVRPLD